MREEGKLQFATGDVVGGRYVLGDRLGVGGMGIVFAAEQPALGRTVAVKMLRPELCKNALALRRFQDEAIAGSRLSHPNIVSVFDFGEAHGAPYLAMQKLAGTPLGQLVCAKGALSPRRASVIVEQVLTALAEAHRQGIVHGDVKSDNVLVAEHDHSTVIDFGLVRIADRPAPDDDEISGTPDYMAPEIVLGGMPTARSDLYAVGCVLYELVTGTTPFCGGNAYSIMSRHLEEPVVRPSVRTPDLAITEDFEEVIATALAKDPRDRYPTASAFIAALHAVTPAQSTHEPRIDIALPVMFSSGATTLDWPMLPRDTERSRCRQHHARRVAIGDAIANGNVDRIAVAYLDLAHAFLGEHDLPGALHELSEGVDVLTRGEGQKASGPAPLWRLLVSMAAISAKLGDVAHARQAALHALSVASYASSALGRRRAEHMLRYLERYKLRRAS